MGFLTLWTQRIFSFFLGQLSTMAKLQTVKNICHWVDTTKCPREPYFSECTFHLLVTPTHVTWIPRLEGNSNQLFFSFSGAPFSTPRQIPLFCQWETTYKAPWVPQNLDTILRILQKRILPENVLGDASPFSLSFWLLYFQLLLLISLVR